MEIPKNSLEQKYRDEMAINLSKEKNKVERRKVLENAKNTRTYWESRFFKVMERRKGEGLETEEAVPAEILAREYQEEIPHPRGEKLVFDAPGKDVYNISAPHEIQGKKYIAGRVENRNEWANSEVSFFAEENGVWTQDKDAPTLKIEDPFCAKIGKEMVIGGVKAWWPEGGEDVEWKTVFYRGENFNNLEEFSQSPIGMKDVRLVDMKDGTIGVFTRPRGSIAKHGKIGFMKINNLDELIPEKIINAKVLKNQFMPDQWGGVNEAHLLDDGRIGVLGHISAHDEKGDKHYYGASFIFDPKTFNYSRIKIIATRAEFPEGEMKVHYPEKPNELADVIFPGGLVRNDDKTATVYCGLNDCEAGRLTIPDPFIEPEKELNL